MVGGFNGSQPVADLDVYDPATDTWTTRAPIPTAGRAIGTALQGKLYVIAGSNAYVYDPGSNKWSSIAAPTWDHDGVVRIVINGKPKLLAVGGLHGRILPTTPRCTRPEGDEKTAWRKPGRFALHAPRRNRTYNLVIKSHLLCQLS